MYINNITIIDSQQKIKFLIFDRLENKNHILAQVYASKRNTESQIRSSAILQGFR